MTNMAKMMQKAQEMKQKMTDMQERVMQMEHEGSAGAGMVAVSMTGRGELKSIKIEPNIVNADDVEVLEDLIVAAVNDARVKAEKIISTETSKVMQELGLPAGMEMPF